MRLSTIGKHARRRWFVCAKCGTITERKRTRRHRLPHTAGVLRSQPAASYAPALRSPDLLGGILVRAGRAAHATLS